MRVTKYNTRLDADKLPMLVKESAFNYNGKLNMTNPNEIYWFLNDQEDLEGLDKECLWLFCFNTKQKFIGYFLVSTGSINVSLVPVREVFIKALAVGSVNIALVHNHPSGDATPSKEDVNVTKRVKEAGALLGINLVDHIVLGDKTYCSMQEWNLF